MSLQEISLLTLSGLFTVVSPTFLYYRKRMSKNSKPENYSKRRILEFTGFNMAINSVAYFSFMLVFLGIITKPGVVFTVPLVLLSAFFLLAAAVTFYGCGMYIASVIIDIYTPRQLRKIPYLRRQAIATDIFHGPISHIIIFSGFIIAAVLLCILDLMTGPTLDSIPRLLLIGGAILGLSMGYAQIVNGTAPYQTITGIVSVIALVFLDWLQGWKFTGSPVGIYMIGFIITFLFLNIYYITFHWKFHNIWTRSGYREYT